MLNLPVGIQDFEELRTGGYVYVDKTKFIHTLATTGKYYFLSRPRRFGKSLLLSTINSLYQGKQALFNGLWISEHWNFESRHPVLLLGFSSIGYKSIGLTAAISLRLQELAKGYGIDIQQQQGIELQLRKLILELADTHGKVVLLVDEYDKPIIDYLDTPKQAMKHREVLKQLYAVLKDLDRSLEMVFLTGVSKFSRMSVFSELNNLEDLTMQRAYANMLGYTQQELEHSFANRLAGHAPEHGGHHNLLTKIQAWYNGYSWDGQQRVYNPHSILNFLKQGTFKNFWFTSGTPTFLVKLAKQRHLYNLEQLQVAEAGLESFELDRIGTEALLFQTGYITILTISGTGLITLGYPNQEVRLSMLQHLLDAFTASEPGLGSLPATAMAQAMAQDDTDTFCQQLNSLLNTIPYELHLGKEAYYHSIVFMALSLVGVHVQAEVHVATGRLDAVVSTDNTVYLIEFKVNQTADTAMQQIEERNYADAYTGGNKRVVALGINFNTQNKSLDGCHTKQLYQPTH